MVKKRKNHVDRGVIEISKQKPRVEEEKFFLKFSVTELNAVGLIVLAATFLVQGVIRYLEIIGQVQMIRPWFLLLFSAMFFLILSVVTVTIDAVLNPLRLKRLLNVASLLSFLLGFSLFLVSLIFLIVVIA